MRWRVRSVVGSASGTADSSACVYGCDGRSYSSSDSADLDDLAEVHHRHPLADVAHHGEVVGDEEVAEAEPLLQVLQQVHDTGLDAHVERRDRLVEHDELRIERQRPGDADALALPTGELVREPAGVVG